jgi:branched-chain amino acid transport system permease protein
MLEAPAGPAPVATCRAPDGLLALGALFLIFAVVPLGAMAAGQGYVVDLATRVMIFAIAAVALDLMLGFAGRLSFGHAAFIGIGAYATAIMAAHGIGDALLCLPAAVLASMLFAGVTGMVCLRTQGVYFIMITLAFGQMVFFIGSSLAPYGGDNGLTIADRNTVAGVAVFHSDRAFYYWVLGSLLGTMVLCRTLVGSRLGRALGGAKQNPARMAAIGIDVYRCELIAYCISGGLAGLSGFLLANAAQFVSPAYMSWHRSGDLIIMVILGGLGTLYGPVLGTATYLVMEELLSGITDDWQVIFGPFLVLSALFARGGLLGLVNQLGRKLSRG